jgi:uncharacterized protein YkwD
MFLVTARALLGIALLLTAMGAAAPEPAILERAAVEAINTIRAQAGLRPLVVSAELTRIARAHSEYQAHKGRIGHTGSKGSSPGERARAGGIDYRAIGENVAMNQGYADPVETAVYGWMKSPGHKKNILTRGFRLTGVGVAVNDDGSVYLTQMFLDPASPR